MAIRSIGTLMTGRFDAPLIEADTVVWEDGIISAVGGPGLLAEYALETVIDAQGMTLMPGLIDSHVHPCLGDYTPRQQVLNFIESSLHGGVTSMISAGEAHTPGRPRDPAGVKALAVLAQRSFANARPAGVKVHGGALILERGLTEADFEELRAAGVWLVGEVGLGSVCRPDDAGPMVAIAHKHGFKVLMHVGGTSIPGSSTVTADDVLAVKPDVVCHINGGPTAVADAEIRRIVEETPYAVEFVQCGNLRAGLVTLRLLAARNEFDRLILGNDAPSGTGVIPLGILRNLAFLVSVGALDPGVAVACATGNTSRVFGLNTGVVEAGREADFVLADAPMGSAGEDLAGALAVGDIPGIGMTIVDGTIRTHVSRNTPPPKRKPVFA
ncbi:MAG: amidohydrolase family protein [Thermoleophilia bacterium]|nr:amidohydrolase family protein [Thermoleophilia bacterium]